MIFHRSFFPRMGWIGLSIVVLLVPSWSHAADPEFDKFVDDYFTARFDYQPSEGTVSSKSSNSATTFAPWKGVRSATFRTRSSCKRACRYAWCEESCWQSQLRVSSREPPLDLAIRIEDADESPRVLRDTEGYPSLPVAVI